MFHGGIPSALSNCTYLRILRLSYNDFAGGIPKEIGNLTKLEELYLSFNGLQGEIPNEIGNLRNLEVLALGLNKLVGVIPAEIFNMSTIQGVGLQNNSLSGSLQSIPYVRLPNLEELYLWGNHFSGSIPNFIFNASKLSRLELQKNSFSGFIPSTFGNLRNLKRLGLNNNHLTSLTLELSFLSSLSNCKYLEFIDLSSNSIDGILSRKSVGNLSHSLKIFDMSDCNVSGSIPEEIGNLTNLIGFYLGGNNLNGSIPITLGKLQKLQVLYFPDNKLEGSIPDEVCRLAKVYQLDLSNNKLSGSIPACFGDLASLRNLSLASNELISVIPSTFWNLKDILYLNLSSNSLTGPLPLEIGNLKVLVKIDFSMNNFSGVIPNAIGGIKDLQFLFLEYNILQGSIPDSFGDLMSLKSLNLSNNNLSGSIPVSLEKLSYLKDLNLSFNKLEGEIPKGGSFGNFSAESFEGNKLLCGSPNLHVPPCKTSIQHTRRKNTILLGIFLPLSTIFMIAVILLIARNRKRGRQQPNDADMPQEATWRRFSYLELCQATDGFSENNLIGRGGFGSVYKARIQDGMEVAVKVFNQQCGRAFKSFDVECEVMKSIRHRNIIKIISCCSIGDFKALVLEYMPHGSLEKFLYSSNCILDIFQRLNIMIDVASALEYLHFGYSVPIIHCDLKPSNVLFDNNMVAHLSDFGIAKLLIGEDQSLTQTQTLATIGYMAPEYGREGRVSTNGDVYSFGIMLIEVFTRKKPTDEIFSGEMTLRCWVNDLLPISVTEVVDANLLSQEDDHFVAKEECMSFVFNLAIKCTVESPEQRINAKEIVTGLSKIRDSLLRNVGAERMRHKI
ncbi:probable LRR receptor-like serine/threonine-protein kinase At3g47570 [Citrus sinensis]|uniref:probable LRR receptor-like serine/threonine-protein kinase At3g47570 n=1 Tax=Citrus sinensis TaxID=2711 RepID=UPI002278E975|nr:probable LRR receptor-like serine/threonine-protein kinase At3g47570 [Citrus sinensis]